MNDLQWKVFRLTQQEHKSYRQTGKELDIPAKQVRTMVEIMKAQQPDLFYYDSEKRRLHNARSGAERKKFNPKIVSIHDLGELTDENIREKY